MYLCSAKGEERYKLIEVSCNGQNKKVEDAIKEKVVKGVCDENDKTGLKTEKTKAWLSSACKKPEDIKLADYTRDAFKADMFP